MNPINEFSAAPHLPYALRNAASTTIRPEMIASALTLAAEGSNSVRVEERNGEIYISFAA